MLSTGDLAGLIDSGALKSASLEPPESVSSRLPAFPSGDHDHTKHYDEDVVCAARQLMAIASSAIARTPVAANGSTVIATGANHGSAFGSGYESNVSSNKENAAPPATTARTNKGKKKLDSAPTESASLLYTQTKINNNTNQNVAASSSESYAQNPRSTILKLKLRCIQFALKEQAPDNSCSHLKRKHATDEYHKHDIDSTDSETDFVAKIKRVKKPVVTSQKTAVSTKKTGASNRRAFALQKEVFAPTKKASIDIEHSNSNKKFQTSHDTAADNDDTMFDAGDEEDFPGNSSKLLSLVTPIMKRNQRILDQSKAEHQQLIANATKVGSEYYDSDAEDMPGNVKDTNKPHLFRNIRWGSYATDYNIDKEFTTEPVFAQFVPGRFELLSDGTVKDQKAKLVIKLIDGTGRKRIFANPPPKDWNNQEAITALNKRTVQQIRRNTSVRFREVVQAYVPVERQWILANLTNGKPIKGWKTLVKDFNERFQGKMVEGSKEPRPFRSHSSLTKEVERFGARFYARGLVPVPAKKGERRGRGSH